MKGFMHVVEVVLVVLLVFFVFAQFSSIPRISTDWSDVKLKLLGNDILSSLDLQGINWFNESEVKERLNQTIPKNIIYNLMLDNVIKPKIVVGCYCDDAKFNQLVSILSPGWFVINDENVSFELVKVGNTSEIFNLDFDVSVFFDYQNLKAQETPLRNFLGHDKGIVEICDLDSWDPAQDSIQEDYFGLRTSTLTPDANIISFHDTSKDVDNEVYNARKYFYHIPLFHDSFDNLDQWNTETGNPAIVEFGDGKSVNLQAGAENTWIYSNYNDFSDGEINLDVYIEGGVFYLEFRLDPATDEAYVAAFSTDPSLGYDAFYSQSSGPVLTYIGSNQSHTTSKNGWHRMKVVVEGGNFELYNDGELVAAASGLTGTGAIGLRHEGGDVYADNVRTTFAGDHQFQNFLSSNENITQLDDNNRKILLWQATSGVAAAIINYDIQEGKGRTVWLSGGGDMNSEEQKVLIKSLMAWTAGNSYDVLKSEIKRPVTVHIYKTFSRDMLQEVRISLGLSYLY